MSMDHYGMEGQLITQEEWHALWMKGNSIARTTLDDGALVSTVWLGINHNWGAGVPLIFETMVFRDGQDEEVSRYATKEEALAGHSMWVDALKLGKKS